MKLINMKLPPHAAEEMVGPSKDHAPRYPWGLVLRLDHEVLEKLGIDTLPEVGSPVTVMATADVTECSANEHTDAEGKTHRHRSVSLQITDLGLASPKADEGATAGRLYDGAKA